MENTTNITYIIPFNERYAFYIAGKLVISALIIGLNSLVICIYCCKQRYFRYMPFNKFLVSLVVCDFQTGITVILTVIESTVPHLMFPQTPSAYLFRILVDIYRAFLAKTIIFHLCGITLDRYLSLFYAYSYTSIVTSKSIKQYIFISWIIPFITSSVQIIWLYRVITGDLKERDIAPVETCYSVITIIVFMIIPLVLLAFAFRSMITEIYRLQKSVPRHHLTLHGGSEGKNRCKAIYIFGLMYLTFILLAMPYFSIRLWIDLNVMMGQTLTWKSNVTIHVAVTMKDLTAIINPVLCTALFPQCRGMIAELRRKVMDNISRLKFTNEFVYNSESEGAGMELKGGYGGGGIELNGGYGGGGYGGGVELNGNNRAPTPDEVLIYKISSV